MLRFIPYLCLVITGLFSCHNQPELVNKTNKNLSVEHQVELVYDSITRYQSSLTGNNQEVFCYLPTDAKNKVLPVVFMFDPHGEAKKALEQYISIAREMNLVWICSRHIKNGVEAHTLHKLVKTLYNFALKNLPIDTTQIILLGFSGGGRIALVESGNFPSVNGIISCGAAQMPSVENASAKHIFIAGITDFNYMECKENAANASKIAQAGFLSFDGKHEWPPEEIIERTIHRCMNKEKLKKISPFSEKEKKLHAYEKKQFQRIAQNFGRKDINWWKTYYRELKNEARQADLDKANSAKRILSYVSMVSYIHAENALKQNNAEYLNYALRIYNIVDPENPDTHFFNACYAALTGQNDKALVELQKAIDLGFSNKGQLINPVYLENLQEDGRFWNLVNGIGN